MFLLNRKRDFLPDTLWNATGMLPRLVLYCKCQPLGAGSMTHAHTHTCSEQSLRILMWNASYVQKHSKYTWLEKVEDQIREGSRRMYFKATARCNISIWAKSLPPWHQVWFENCLKKRRAGSGLGRMPSSKINEIVKMILQAMSTTSMPRSAGTGEWSVHPSPIIP